MPKIPTLVELLEAGVHFGHQPSKGHPKMKPFVYSISNGVQIIDLEKTVDYLKRALDFIKEEVSQGKTILFLGTKYQARKIIQEIAQEVGMPFITEKWVGGMITNFPEIHKRIRKLRDWQEKQKRGEFNKYTKGEQMKIKKEIDKLEKIFGGVRDLDKLPDILFVVDVKRELTAVKEARKAGIPIVAIVDTNVNPQRVNYIIPANDDGIKSIRLILGLVKEAIKEGLEEKKGEEKEKEKEEKEKKGEGAKEDKKQEDK